MWRDTVDFYPRPGPNPYDQPDLTDPDRALTPAHLTPQARPPIQPNQHPNPAGATMTRTSRTPWPGPPTSTLEIVFLQRPLTLGATCAIQPLRLLASKASCSPPLGNRRRKDLMTPRIWIPGHLLGAVAVAAEHSVDRGFPLQIARIGWCLYTLAKRESPDLQL